MFLLRQGCAKGLHINCAEKTLVRIVFSVNLLFFSVINRGLLVNLRLERVAIDCIMHLTTCVRDVPRLITSILLVQRLKSMLNVVVLHF